MEHHVSASNPRAFGMFLVDAFVGTSMIPIFNIFLPILAIALGADPFQVGLVGGASNAVYAFMPFVMGRFSDVRESRRFFVVASLGLLTVVSVLYAVSSNAYTLILLRILEGTAWSMFWPTIEAEMTRGQGRDPNKSLSLFNAVWSGAFATGPIIGSLAVLLLSLRLAFFVTAGILFCALIPNLFQLLHRGNEEPPQAQSRRGFAQSGQTSALKRNRSFLNLVLAGNVLVAVSYSVLITFYGPYAQSVGISIAAIGAVTFTYGFFRFLFFYLATHDNFRRAVLQEQRLSYYTIISTALTCLSVLIFLTGRLTILISIIVFSVVGASQTFVVLISQVVTIAEASAERKGTRAGLLESTTGVGAALGPILGGVLSSQSLSNAFFVPGISFACIMLPLVAYESRRRSDV